MDLTAGTTTGGVPYVARLSAAPDAPVLVVWHLMDPPSSPRAMATALPFAGLDASVIHLGLPLTGDRAVHGDFDGMLESGVDVVTEFFGPMNEQAASEFLDAVDEVLPLAGRPLVLIGGSAGAAAAAEAAPVAASAGRLAALVLLNPLLRLRPMIDAMAEFLPEPYAWSDASDAVAVRMDYVARAGELAATGAPILVVEGSDDEQHFLDSTRAFERLGIADVRFVDGVSHALTDWPEVEGAPQTEEAAAYDRIIVDWLRTVDRRGGRT